MKAWWLCASLLVLGSAAALAQEEPASRPSFWRAERSDGSTAFHVLGSVHLGRPGMLNFSPVVGAAFEAADTLVLEVTPEDLRSMDALELMRRGAIAPPESLRDRLSADTLSELARYFERRGESLDRFLQVEPWMLNVTLAALEAQRLGLSPEHGVDRYFADRAQQTGKPMEGLETADFQLRLLAELPASAHELLIQDTLLRLRKPGQGIEGVLRAWQTGDDAALERLLLQPVAPRAVEALRSKKSDLALFYERLMFGRNETMAQSLAGLARDGKHRFVLVGAGHLVGPRGIPHLLRDYGFRIERVETP